VTSSTLDVLCVEIHLISFAKQLIKWAE